MTGLLVTLGVLAVVVVAVWLAHRVPHPEETSSHDEPALDTPSERFYRGADAPAGPDAEDPVGPFDPRDPARPTPPPP
ncbi:MAG: hypothetical protein JWM47_2934 [Acidimicrobiales bacterium]|nr:hypothetical protein [Acidimicrobiales bacterium]